MSPTDKTEVKFFQNIKDMLPANLSLVDEVADLLKISNDSAYRRIRGETALTLDEVKVLSEHFKISLDAFLGASSNAVTFEYKALNSQESSFEEYLSAILDNIKGIDKFDQKDIIYAAKDIPIFHHFLFPELSAFKIFFWMKSVLNVSKLEQKQFDISEANENFIELGKQILTLYIKIPSVEIWTEETLNSTLKQLEYSWDSGFFQQKEDATLLCDQLSAMILHIQKEAELSFKFSFGGKPVGVDGNFVLYFSEVMIGNNNILVTIGNTKTTYLTHNTLNYLITNNINFCNETEQSLKNLIKKSTLISGVSEKQRNQFFRKAQDNIQQLRDRIQK